MLLLWQAYAKLKIHPALDCHIKNQGMTISSFAKDIIRSKIISRILKCHNENGFFNRVIQTRFEIAMGTAH